jgi:hypothetical protein
MNGENVRNINRYSGLVECGVDVVDGDWVVRVGGIAADVADHGELA